MVEECQSMNQKCFPIDSKSKLRRAFELLDNAGTSTGNRIAAQNDSVLSQFKDANDDVIIIDDGNEIAAVPNNTAEDNLSEQSTKVIIKPND